jgi:hypothetical protein
MDQEERPFFAVLANLPEGPVIGELRVAFRLDCSLGPTKEAGTTQFFVIPIGSSELIQVDFSRIMPLTPPSRAGAMPDGVDCGFVIF